MVTKDLIGKSVYARNPDGSPALSGSVLSICTETMVHIQTSWGERMWWKASLCNFPTNPDPHKTGQVHYAATEE